MYCCYLEFDGYRKPAQVPHYWQQRHSPALFRPVIAKQQHQRVIMKQNYTKYTAYFDNIEIMWIRNTVNNNGPLISVICCQISEQYYIWQWLGAQ